MEYNVNRQTKRSFDHVALLRRIQRSTGMGVKQETDINELLDYLDGLYGRDNLEDETDLDEVREEAIRQCREDFTDKSSDEYSLAQFHVKLYQANQRGY